MDEVSKSNLQLDLPEDPDPTISVIFFLFSNLIHFNFEYYSEFRKGIRPC